MYLRHLDTATKGYKKTKVEKIKFMKRIAGHSLLDHRRNEDILEELSGSSREEINRALTKMLKPYQ
jgi:hypothetical protein